ncbi:urea ABC transporter substrate-binding protein [Candidatus Pelagibacter sp.]|jgi:urea transport system substrate-binding protein|nr:urea ABC transporter substrate-binding protein [Candidatus Pelagibacter sp.]|tara:strand:+ start:41 stop:1273 length:1233 start_codon:yes stop_codon:yes gene_type:complete
MKKIVVFMLTSFLFIFSSVKADTIKLGILEDETGNFAIAVVPKIHAYELAVKEINANGGVLGKKLEIVRYDTQSDNRRFQEFARRLIKKDKVDVVFGAFSSASRESIRGIMEKNKMLYFYNNQYEGGVCSKTTFMTGAVPEQQFSTLVPWMMEKYGKNVYTIAADYNFGQISAEWVRQIVKENGGTMVGEEFIPLDVSQYSQTIQKIQKAKPDVLMTLLVGAKQASFYEQQASAGLKIPMATSINVGQAYEHKRFAPPALENMYVTVNYIEEVHDVIKSGEFHDKSKDYVKRFRALYPDEPYINMESANAYNAIYIYAKAVEKAGTTETMKVVEALESGISQDGPSGVVTMDPKSHHGSHTIFLIEVGKGHKVSIPKIWKDIKPYWLGESGCDLANKADYSQYTPSNPPS